MGGGVTGTDGQLTPILVRMMDARVGSTALLQLFTTAPQIAMDRKFRYEHSYLTYLVRLMSQISEFHPEPAGDDVFTMEEVVYPQDSRLGPLPFEPMIVDAQALARCGLGDIWRRFSEQVRSTTPEATHYAEKFWGDVQTVVAAGLDPILIDLVRDPRDVVASNRAYNEKYGDTLFGRTQATSESDHLRRLIARIRFRLNEMDAPVSARRLTVRYEDLIRSPNETYRRVQETTGVPLHPEQVGALSSQAKQHITAGSVEASIGRWQHDLDETDVHQIERRLGQSMRKLGYEVAVSA